MADEQTPAPRKWYHAIGPGLITACVVIGPGSIMTSTNVGAQQGFGMVWVVVAAVLFMAAFTVMGARLGVVTGKSACDLIADKAGRKLAVVIGLGVFFISASFQYGNNLGVHYAFEGLGVQFQYMVVVFNAVALIFLFGFKNLYRAVERMMMIFVGLMLLAFAANLIYSGPNLMEFAKGLVPGGQSKIDLSVLALVGTTFVVTAAFYQSYLVRQKGWGPDELQSGIIDARVGAGIMAVITLVLMSTAATLLYPTFHKQVEITAAHDGNFKMGAIVERVDFDKSVEALKEAEKKPPEAKPRTLKKPTEVADQLKELFGGWGRTIFCMGLFAAAFSSFLVNSMIGGFILSDGLGLGSRPEDPWPRRLTAVVLLTGMGVALFVLLVLKEQKPAQLIIFAQAITVIASPLMAGALWWLAANEEVMGDQKNRPLANVLAGIGFILLLSMSIRVAVVSVWPAISKALG